MSVSVERVYNAPVDRVWQALTDKDRMKEWYFDLEAFIPEVGFQFSFTGQGHTGEQYLHVCIVTEVVYRKKLQYSWSYEGYPGYSRVTFELFEEGEKTRLRLTHEGLETFPQDNPDFAPGNFNDGWNYLLGKSLTEYLEGT